MKLFVVLALAAVACATPDADADPAVLYRSLGFANHYGLGYAYNGYAGFPYGYANAYSAFPYASYAYNPYYHHAGYRTFFKRDADADADPAVLYGSLAYAPYAAYSAPAALGYRFPYAAHAYNPYVYSGYAHGYAHPYSYYNGYNRFFY